MAIIVFLAFVALIVGGAWPAFAQAHPCDTTINSVDVNPTAPYALGFCHNGKDAEGNTIAIDGWKVAVNGTIIWTGVATKGSTPNASGQFYYETPKILTSPKGTYTITASGFNADGDGPPSDPLSFGSKGLPPGKPIKSRIVK